MAIMLISGAPGAGAVHEEWLSSARSQTSQLGDAVQTAFGLRKEQLVDVHGDTNLPSPSVDVPMFGMIDNRSDLETALSITASGKYGGVSAHASWSRSYKESRRSIFVGYAKRIQTSITEIEAGAWTAEALKLWESGPEAFYRRYGDSYVKALVYGGSCGLVFQFDFQSMEETEAFSGGVGAKFGPGSKASLDITSKTLRSARATSIRMFGSVVGAKSFPKVKVDLDERVGFIPAQQINLATLANVIDFFNDFDDLIVADTLIGYRYLEVNSVPGAPDSTAATDVGLRYAERLQDIEDLRASLEDARADLVSITEEGRKWNVPQAVEEAIKLGVEVDARLAAVDRAAERLVTGYQLDVALPERMVLPGRLFIRMPPAHDVRKTAIRRGRSTVERPLTADEKKRKQVYVRMSASANIYRGTSYFIRFYLYGVDAGGERTLLDQTRIEVGGRSRSVSLDAPVPITKTLASFVAVADADGYPRGTLQLEVRY